MANLWEDLDQYATEAYTQKDWSSALKLVAEVLGLIGLVVIAVILYPYIVAMGSAVAAVVPLLGILGTASFANTILPRIFVQLGSAYAKLDRGDRRLVRGVTKILVLGIGPEDVVDAVAYQVPDAVEPIMNLAENAGDVLDFIPDFSKFVSDLSLRIDDLIGLAPDPAHILEGLSDRVSGLAELLPGMASHAQAWLSATVEHLPGTAEIGSRIGAVLDEIGQPYEMLSKVAETASGMAEMVPGVTKHVGAAASKVKSTWKRFKLNLGS